MFTPLSSNFGKCIEVLAEKDADEGEQASQRAKLRHLTPEKGKKNNLIVDDMTDR